MGNEKTTAIILAGGTGERMGRDVPKQFMLLSGKPVISYSILAFDGDPNVTDILIVCHKDHMGRLADIVDGIKPGKESRIVPGGKTRQESSYMGVKACHAGTKYVLIHDAARPFVDGCIINNVREGAKLVGSAAPAIDTEDTIVSHDGSFMTGVPDRKTLKRVQTPQAFAYDVILKAHEEASKKGVTSAPDDCSLVLGMGGKVSLADGSVTNIKITGKADLSLAEKLQQLKKDPA